MRYVHVDDVKATTIKEKIKHMSTIYRDFHKPKSNPDRCINLVGVLNPITIFT